MALKLPILSIISITFALTACANKGFHREELQSSVGVVTPEFNEKNIEKAYKKKANLPKPFRMAVYFKTPQTKSDMTPWRWTPEDKNILTELETSLKEKGLVSAVFPVVSTLVTDESLQNLRLIAAQHQADALLVISGAGEINRSANGWAVSYAALLPMAFAKGNEAETLFLTTATLWDVKNELLYLTAETEATTLNASTPFNMKTDKELYSEARIQALAKLQEELKKQTSLR
jgi:rhombotail lipoprotein